MLLNWCLVLLVSSIDAFIPRFSFPSLPHIQVNPNYKPYKPFENFVFRPFRPLKSFLPKVHYIKVVEGSPTTSSSTSYGPTTETSIPTIPTIPTTPTTPTTVSPIDPCEGKEEGFALEGECYIYQTHSVTYVGAKAKCETHNGQLWAPDVNNPDLYKNVVKASPGFLFGAPNQEVWIGIKGSVNDITGEDLSSNHLVLTAFAPSSENSNCAVIRWDTGAFYLSYNICAGIAKKHYVCKL